MSDERTAMKILADAAEAAADAARVARADADAAVDAGYANDEEASDD